MAIDGGFVKIYRKSLHSPKWKNANLWRFWEWCLLKAVYKPMTTFVRYKEVALLPGQLVYGRRMAQEETGLSEQTLKTCVRTLSEGKKPSITVQTTRTHSIITILNWERYQNDGLRGNQQPTTETANFQPTSNPLPTTIKEVQETKKHTYADFFAAPVSPMNSIEGMEATYSPTYREVLDAYKEECAKAGRGFALDANTKDGARTITADIDQGKTALDDVRHAIAKILADQSKSGWGLKGIAANYGNYLPAKKKSKDRFKVRFQCDKCGWAEVLLYSHSPDMTADGSGYVVSTVECGSCNNGFVRGKPVEGNA